MADVRDYVSLQKVKAAVQHKEKLLVIITAILLPLLTLAMDYSKMWAFGDLAPFPTDLEVIGGWIFESWRAEGLGYPNNPVANYYLAVMVTSTLFGSFAAQKILFMSTIVISFLSFFLFQRSFNFGFVNSYVAAICFAFNPVLIASFVGGAIGELMTFAVFPLFAMCVYKSLSAESLRLYNVIVIGLITVFMWNNYVFFWLSVIILPGLILIAIRRDVRKLKRLVPLAGVALLVLSPNIFGLAAISQQLSGDSSTFTSTAAYTYTDISASNLIRLAGNTGSAQSNEFLGYNQSNSNTVLGFVLSSVVILAIITTIIWRSNIDAEKNKLLLSMVGVLVFSIAMLLFISAFPSAVDQNNILSSLRNPGKLMYVLVFAFAALLSFGIHIIINILPKSIPQRQTVALVFIPFIFLYNLPALDGTLGVEKVRLDQYTVDDKYYDLKKTLDTLGIDSKENRLLILPWEYPSFLRVRGEVPNFFGLAPTVQQNNVGVAKMFEIFTSIEKDAGNKADFLALYGVDHIVVDKSFRSYYAEQDWYKSLGRGREAYVFSHTNSYWLTGNPSHFYTIFKDDSNFRLIHEDESFAIFQNEIRYGRVYETSVVADNQSTTFVESSPNKIRNSSFEEGATGWSQSPSSLISITQDSSDGRNSISLSGQKQWFTNIYQVVPVKGSTWYLLQFDYRSQNMTDFHAKILWSDHDNPGSEADFFKSDYLRVYEKSLPDGQWHSVHDAFLSPSNAKEARIQFLASRVDAEYETTQVEIDNISFSEAQPIVSSLADGQGLKQYEQLSPTHYLVQSDHMEPYVLVLTESYNSAWVARSNVGGQVVEYAPIPSDSLTRFFVSKPEISHSLQIEYTSQGAYLTMMVLSILTIFSSVVYLSYTTAAKLRFLRPLANIIYTTAAKLRFLRPLANIIYTTAAKLRFLRPLANIIYTTAAKLRALINFGERK